MPKKNQKLAEMAKALNLTLPIFMALVNGQNVKMLFGSVNLEALLEMYDPTTPDDIATTMLQRRFGNEPLIAYSDTENMVVAVAESARYINSRRLNEPATRAIYVADKLAQLYPAGVLPNVFANEDPLEPGQGLNQDVSTVYVDFDYTGMTLETRQFIRLLVELREINPTRRLDRITLLNLAKTGFDTLAETFQETALEFNRRKAAGTLPTLKIDPNAPKPTQLPQQPRQQNIGSGINISGGSIHVGGDIVGGDKIVNSKWS